MKNDTEEVNYMQAFKCLKCELLANAPYKHNDSPLKVISKIKEVHEEQSPNCQWDVKNIMIYSEGAMH